MSLLLVCLWEIQNRILCVHLQAAEAQAAKDVSERRHLMAARDSEFRARAALEVECQALRADLAQVRMETSGAIVSAMLQRRSADARAAAALATLQHTCDAALHDSEQQQVRHAAEVAQLTAAREGVQADAAAALAQKEADLQRHVTATQSLQKRLKAAEHRLTQQKAETTRTSEEAARVRDQLAAEIQSLTNELADLQNDRSQSAEEWRLELERRDQQLSSQQSEYEQVKASLEQVRAAQEAEMNRLSAQFETAMESYRMTVRPCIFDLCALQQ
jgi:chromosome segregation ATPase